MFKMIIPACTELAEVKAGISVYNKNDI